MAQRGANPETAIQRAVLISLNLFRHKGLMAYRINNAPPFDILRGVYRKQGQFNANGISDILIIAKGMVIFMEVKTATGKLSPSQIEFQTQCARCGVPYEVVRSSEEALDVLRKYKIIGGELDELSKSHTV